MPKLWDTRLKTHVSLNVYDDFIEIVTILDNLSTHDADVVLTACRSAWSNRSKNQQEVPK